MARVGSEPANAAAMREMTVQRLAEGWRSMLSAQFSAFAQHFLYFLPLPQGQGSFRPTLGSVLRIVIGVSG